MESQGRVSAGPFSTVEAYEQADAQVSSALNDLRTSKLIFEVMMRESSSASERSECCLPTFVRDICSYKLKPLSDTATAAAAF